MLQRIVLIFALSILVGKAAMADELTAEKAADIKRLMDITGSTNIARQFASASSQGIFQVLKMSRPDVPDRALAVMDRELVALFSEKIAVPGGLIDQIIPIYGKYFTHQEIRALLAFYETPVGQKAIAVLPMVVNESLVAGQLWGQSLGPDIEKRVMSALRQEGLIPQDQ